MISRFSFLLFFAFCSLNAQQTYVPDDGFEQYLIHNGYDDVLDNYVLTSNINTVEDLDLQFSIEDLTGLEDFTNLKNLSIYSISAPDVDLSNNNLLESLYIYTYSSAQIDISECPNLKNISLLNVQITEIDLSNNPLLEEFKMYNVPITHIDFSQNPNLKIVDLSNTDSISEIDFSNNSVLEDVTLDGNSINQINLSQNQSLKKAAIRSNQLSEIDFSNNILIEVVGLSNCPITQIDLTQNTKLKSFSMRESLITEIDFSNNPLIESIDLYNYFLADIDLSNNLHLKQLEIYGGMLTTVDTSNLPSLEIIRLGYGDNLIQYIDLSNNPNLVRVEINDIDGLDYLNIQNGNNTNITHFSSTSNNTLYCIQVDDPIWSEENWYNVDSHTSFESFCEFILNTNDIKSPENFKFYPNPVENTITIENPDLTIDKINLIDVNGKTVFTKSLNTNPIKLNLKSYPKGIYFLQLLSGEKIIQTEKIIKK